MTDEQAIDLVSNIESPAAHTDRALKTLRGSPGKNSKPGGLRCRMPGTKISKDTTISIWTTRQRIAETIQNFILENDPRRQENSMSQQSESPIKTDIPARERLIFALDVPDLARARQLVDALDDSVVFYKLGLEFFPVRTLLRTRRRPAGRGKKIFADLKLFDIPATVASAVRQLARHDVHFCTVHGNDSMLKAAAEAKGDMQILAVTALTSLDQGDLNDLGFQCDARTLVLSRARRALELGCDGVVSSGLEVPALRESVDHALITVCPGYPSGLQRRSTR